jgi:hypothetical protein
MGWLALASPLLVVAAGGVLAPLAVPLLSPAGFLRYQAALGVKARHAEKNAVGEMPQYFADRFGWENLAGAVASIIRQLPEAERSGAAIVAMNYGEAGAINYYGPRLGLPTAVCGHNNHFLWTGAADGREPAEPTVAIVIGSSAERLSHFFERVEVASIVRAQYAMPYETNLPLHVCRGWKRPWSEFRLALRRFI